MTINKINTPKFIIELIITAIIGLILGNFTRNYYFKIKNNTQYQNFNNVVNKQDNKSILKEKFFSYFGIKESFKSLEKLKKINSKIWFTNYGKLGIGLFKNDCNEIKLNSKQDFMDTLKQLVNSSFLYNQNKFYIVFENKIIKFNLNIQKIEAISNIGNIKKAYFYFPFIVAISDYKLFLLDRNLNLIKDYKFNSNIKKILLNSFSEILIETKNKTFIIDTKNLKIISIKELKKFSSIIDFSDLFILFKRKEKFYLFDRRLKKELYIKSKLLKNIRSIYLLKDNSFLVITKNKTFLLQGRKFLKLKDFNKVVLKIANNIIYVTKINHIKLVNNIEKIYLFPIKLQNNFKFIFSTDNILLFNGKKFIKLNNLSWKNLLK